MMKRQQTQQELRCPLTEATAAGWLEWRDQFRLNGQWLPYADADVHPPGCYICFQWCPTCVESWWDVSLPQHACDGFYGPKPHGRRYPNGRPCHRAEVRDSWLEWAETV